MDDVSALKQEVATLKQQLQEYKQTQDQSSHVSSFNPSKPEPGQEWCVWTYALAKEAQNGIVGIVKVIGTYPSKKRAEDRKDEEHQKDKVRISRVAPTGHYMWLVDPRHVPSNLVDKYCTNERAKELVALANKDLKDQEKELIEEAKQNKARLEEQDKRIEDPESIEHYMMLRIKVRDFPGQIIAMQSRIEQLKVEMERLSALIPKLQIAAKTMEEKHPDYDGRWEKEVKERLT